NYISHTYTDHVSILKFIERNWNLNPLSPESLDQLPNPKPTPGNPYVPENKPAIGDLFDMFSFPTGAGAHAARTRSAARIPARLIHRASPRGAKVRAVPDLLR